MFVALVPAWNEERHIKETTHHLLSFVDCVVVIDDGSKDQTATYAIDAGAVVLSHTLNCGQGAALETGHTYARKIGANLVLHFDADGQFSVDDIIPAKQFLQAQHADILFGSRYLTPTDTIPWQKRQFIHPIGRGIDRLFGAVQLSDVHNGFRLLNQHALDSIHITQDRMAHATEIPILVKHHQLHYVEFPVHVQYDEYGQNARAGLTILKDLFFHPFLK